ncbi:hypothetical protein [Qaidamihabitans albus]|uniref:hypothetical protein n=1 Tax=Qaidamihabitans albus TaxID=2795733 RepID=UPI0018F1C87B|nr:hypothetical protein [Qaidamihabitans albus]
MTGHLDTAVEGDPNSCAEAADTMGTLATAAAGAADEFGTALATAQAGWQGPASESFLSAVHFLHTDLDEIASTGEKISSGLAEFGFALAAAIAKMADIRGQAAAGGLEVDGTIILPPQPGPVLKRYGAILAGSRQQGRLLSDEDREYIRSDEVSQALDAHNAKVRLYNDCIDSVREVREREEEAHRTLHDVITPPARKLGDVMIRVTALSVAFTAGKQAYNALQGHQSWGEAGSKVPSIVAGGLAGGSNGAAVGTFVWPGPGTVVGGVLGTMGGSVVGGILGSKVADFVLPEKDLLGDVDEQSEIPLYRGS